MVVTGRCGSCARVSCVSFRTNATRRSCAHVAIDTRFARAGPAWSARNSSLACSIISISHGRTTVAYHNPSDVASTTQSHPCTSCAGNAFYCTGCVRPPPPDNVSKHPLPPAPTTTTAAGVWYHHPLPSALILPLLATTPFPLLPLRLLLLLLSATAPFPPLLLLLLIST